MAHQAASFPGGLPPNLIRGAGGHIGRNPAFDKLSLAQRNFLLGSGPKVDIPAGFGVFKPNIAPADIRTAEGKLPGAPAPTTLGAGVPPAQQQALSIATGGGLPALTAQPGTSEYTRQLLERGNILGAEASKQTGIPFTPTPIPAHLLPSHITGKALLKGEPLQGEIGLQARFAGQDTGGLTPTGTGTGVDPELAALRTQLDAIQKRITESIAPSQAEIDLQQQLQNLIASRELGIQKVEEEPIATPFITGQAAAITKRAGIQALPLQARLSALQSQRQAAFDVAKTQLGFEERKLERAEDRRIAEEALLTKELDTQIIEVGGRKLLVNRQTGETIRDLGLAELPGTEKLNTQIIEVNGRKLLVNKQTGETIRDLGLADIPEVIQPTEPQPQYTPVGGFGSLSSQGQWKYTQQGWIPAGQTSGSTKTKSQSADISFENL